MPKVYIRISEEGATTEQKFRLAEDVAQLLQGILGSNQLGTVMSLDVDDLDKWGIVGDFSPDWMSSK